METEKHNKDQDSELVGLLAQFDDPDALVHACNEARLAGYKSMDAYSPFPVHGIDPAIGIKRSWLPFLVFAIGFGAAFVGLGLQFYTNGGMESIDTSEVEPFPGYGFFISGKPKFSVPANIPVTFEIIVLSSAFAAFLGMWGLNKLPLFANPLHRISRFKRATNDKFFLMLEAKDGKFDRFGTEGQLNEWGAVAIDECRQDLTDQQLPRWVWLVGLIGIFLLMLPPVMIFRSMGMVNRQPRLHVVPDMDYQHKYKAQVMAPKLGDGDYLFIDERAARQPVAGSIARGQLENEQPLHRGWKEDYVPPANPTTGAEESARNGFDTNPARLVSAKLQDEEAAGEGEEEPVEDVSMWITEFPEEINVNAELMARGQQRFNVYCSTCHGYTGNGDGLVNQRAMALAATGQAQWTAAKSLHDPTVMDAAKNPLGRIYDTITNGRNTMGPYGDQIPVHDRWAIVAYVKALQETGIDPANQMMLGAQAPAAPATDETAADESETNETESDETETDEADSEETSASQPETGAEPADSDDADSESNESTGN